MKADFNQNILHFPKSYTRVALQQGRPVIDADTHETASNDAATELKQIPQGDWSAVSNLGERVLLAQLQKADLRHRQPQHGLAVNDGASSVQVESKAAIEPGLIDSREDVRRHRERLGNRLAKLHGEKALPDREKILKEINLEFAELSKALEKNISLLKKFKGGLEQLSSGSDSLLEKTIPDIAAEIKDNQEQLGNVVWLG